MEISLKVSIGNYWDFFNGLHLGLSGFYLDRAPKRLENDIQSELISLGLGCAHDHLNPTLPIVPMVVPFWGLPFGILNIKFDWLNQKKELQWRLQHCTLNPKPLNSIAHPTEAWSAKERP